MKIEVRYYSRSGNTKALGEAIARGVGVNAISIDDEKSNIVDNIDSWHWVTIVGIKYLDNDLICTVTDEGELKEINISSWLKTTTKNGGFIYYS